MRIEDVLARLARAEQKLAAAELRLASVESGDIPTPKLRIGDLMAGTATIELAVLPGADTAQPYIKVDPVNNPGQILISVDGSTAVAVSKIAYPLPIVGPDVTLVPSSTFLSATTPVAVSGKAAASRGLYFAWSSSGAAAATNCEWRLYDLTNSLVILDGSRPVNFADTIESVESGGANLPAAGAKVALQVRFDAAEATARIVLSTPVLWEAS